MPSFYLTPFLGIGVLMALSGGNRLTLGRPHPVPMPLMALAVDELVQIVVQPPEQESQEPSWIPVGDVVVEVVAPLPLRTELINVTRLLGQRQSASHGNNDYPSTILELIKLVEPNPKKPRGSWKSIAALEISFDKKTKEMIVAYCVDKCRLDEKVHPKRKMISYRASEERVAKRMNERLAELQQTVVRPIKPK